MVLFDRLPLPDGVLQVLKQVMDESEFKGPDDLIFATEKGTPPDEKNLMRRIIKPIAKELDMPWMDWHVCRHTHSTLAEELGMALTFQADTGVLLRLVED
jgi:integrase